ncbi:flagellar assembly peptidoglycan hydrolase FlgJ [Undibacterium sp. Jales W-56]|uniref:flagellar assembly peptidoglycan hydrolase FlgJ n=1 Tax=Undibacterium sp. Jales W-56 TaxID=2897325 RepID=UPI0021D235D4|nr:flagellar assembly peptidoglycan hydrolase FlgJ [Undibacterium sp. Jales W-56]MCU6433226.1 flagellar assembly peptidoglycan hydrolase FlgJ [Undibacterium sp. Jales W-56]
MIGRTDITDKLAFDSKSLDGLKQSSKDNSPESLKAAAKQFEALFMNMMLKSMRQAGGQDGPFDNEQSKMYTSMLDQQLSQNMANRGVGLADALVRQLSNNQVNQLLQADGVTQSGMPSPSSSIRGIESYLDGMKLGQQVVPQGKTSGSTATHVREFQQKLSAHAEQASAETGIPAKFMLGQAALESGWGKKEIKSIDGTPSHNLFGMKAGSQWKGKTVDAVTTEYVNGVACRKVEKFKAYDSYSEAFKDYAKLLTKNPRYENVIANAKDATSFAYGLQKAGYATDPQYANKLFKIINHTLST